VLLVPCAVGPVGDQRACSACSYMNGLMVCPTACLAAFGSLSNRFLVSLTYKTNKEKDLSWLALSVIDIDIHISNE
jgi:hypothetical protein